MAKSESSAGVEEQLGLLLAEIERCNALLAQQSRDISSLRRQISDVESKCLHIQSAVNGIRR